MFTFDGSSSAFDTQLTTTKPLKAGIDAHEHEQEVEGILDRPSWTERLPFRPESREKEGRECLKEDQG
jgi:hypothetical protein